MVLRPLTEPDAAELRRILSEPEVSRWWDEPEEDFPLGDDPESTRLVIEVDGEMAREGVPLIVIQRQLGHSNLGITSVYLQGIDSGEIIETVHARRAPMIPVSASLRL
jgi:RimJ/RimL family protein N-acetyltransferase